MSDPTKPRPRCAARTNGGHTRCSAVAARKVDGRDLCSKHARWAEERKQAAAEREARSGQ